MQRMICKEFGDPRSLELIVEDDPKPAPGQLLIEVEHASVSFVDGLVVRGAYQVKPPLPFTPGNCLVGRVRSVGDGVDPAMAGMRVGAVLPGIGGAYTSHRVVPCADVTLIPDSVSSEVAAGAMESYLTVTFATQNRVDILEGDEVVVLGAGGGIGLAAVDTARSLGGRVTAVASVIEKREAALAAGAAVAIGYDDLKVAIREATAGGADVVIDPVGGTASESALRALAANGRLCVLGFASGEIPRFPANVVLLRNRSVVGVDWGDWSRESGGATGNARLLNDVLAKIASGVLHPPRPTVMPLEDAGQALHLISTRQAVGRYVLQP